MTDPTAAALACVLLLIGGGSYARRDALQPNRAAAAGDLTGTVAWGLALAAIWIAWASGSPNAGLCADHSCDHVVESIEANAADLQPGVFLTEDLPE